MQVKPYKQILEVVGSQEDIEYAYERVKEVDESATVMVIGDLKIIGFNSEEALVMGRLAAAGSKIHKRTVS